MSITFVMAEFGKDRKNAGGESTLKYSRLDPAYTEFKKYFPDAEFTVYTDFDIDVVGKDIEVIKVDPPFDISRRRYGWEANDYYKVLGLLKTTTDISIAIDSDIVPISKDVLWLPKIIERFGCVAPLNPRMIVRIDNHIGGGGKQALECDVGLVTNSVPLGLYRGNLNACKFIWKAKEIMQETKGRLPVVLWKAAWDRGYRPCVLPPQWCVCQEHTNLKHKIILHIGHPKINEIYERDYGGIKTERDK